LRQHRRARRQRIAYGPVPELERVAEQHEAVELGQPRDQRRALLRSAQDVGPAVRAQVEIRDDERAQRSRRRRPAGSPSGA
ncbi:MAG: hypothetical protein WB761_33670, partial [Solirubrobacteraceae bacterium]